ncbi:hypothetical protein KUTeg_010296 [Tegillarca granosa]|uniref:Uncharacterized protein n=1 Tax=Tegillarca granosa TaxID=220873 RepID=A0ABQ9F6B6_TEGGR|nr:hypothetical protein KUTeg_010296 [Tegillarca granosa]
MKMAVMQTLLILLSISFVIGEDTEWNSPNVSACFNVPDVAIDFVYTPSGGDSSFLLVSWHRKVVSQGSVEESIAELDDDRKFLVLPNTALVGRLNKTGEFGLLISNPTTGDSDPCIKQEEGPKNNTEETITICEGDSGTYTCCVTTSSTNCIMAKITAPNGTGSPVKPYYYCHLV